MGTLRSTIRRYDRWDVRAFIAIKDRFFLPLRPIEQRVPKQGKMCELGSGLGMVSIYLALSGKGRDITGYELDSRRVKTASAAADGLSNVRFVEKDLTKDADIGIYDTFLLIDFLHHVPYASQERILDVISKNRGRIILKEIDKGFGIKYSLNFFCDKVMTRLDKLWFRKGDEWKALLESYGYRVRKERIPGIFPHTILIGEQ